MVNLSIVIVCLSIQQVSSYGDLLSRPQKTPFIFTPNVPFFYGAFDHSVIKDALNTIQEIADILEESPSSKFSEGIIAGFRSRLKDTRDHLARALGTELDRKKRDADDDLDIISYSQCLVGNAARTVGLASKCDIDDIEAQVRIIQDDWEQTDKTISTRLGVLTKSMTESIKSINATLARKINETNGFHEKHLSLTIKLEGLFSHLDQIVRIVYEIRDRADQNLPPRSIISRTTIQEWMEQATDKYPGYYPIYQDPDNFFELSYTLTFLRNQKFIVMFAMPLQEKREFFFKKQETSVFTNMESTTHKVQLTVGQETECHKSAQNLVCIFRSCRIDKFTDVIRTCLLTSSHDGSDTVEVVYNKTYLQNRGQDKLFLNCPGKATQVIEVQSEILQLTLPLSCSLKNSYLDIERVVATTTPVYNNPPIQYKNYSLEVGAQMRFKSEGTNLEVKKLASEEAAAKEKSDAAKHSQEHRNKHNDDLQEKLKTRIIAIPIVTAFVLAIIILVMGCFLRRKKAREMRQQEDQDLESGQKLSVTEEHLTNQCEVVTAEKEPDSVLDNLDHVTLEEETIENTLIQEQSEETGNTNGVEVKLKEDSTTLRTDPITFKFAALTDNNFFAKK